MIDTLKTPYRDGTTHRARLGPYVRCRTEGPCTDGQAVSGYTGYLAKNSPNTEDISMNPKTINSVRTLCLAPAAALILMSAAAEAQSASPKAVAVHEVSKTTSAVEVRLAMRTLWEEHITYTRNYIISAVAGLPDSDAVAQRLLRNQDDIGNAIKPYYGDAAGKKLTSLLRDHILVATEVVKAAKAGNQAQLAAVQQKWSANGKDIAGFLSGANPNWSRKTLEGMLQKHLELTTAEVVGRLKSNWAADIKAYDDGHAHMLMFADMLTDGIARQFPAKFKR